MNKKHHDVLVLNRGYVPLHIITWQDSMKYLVKDAAHALDRTFIAYNIADWIKFSIANAEDRKSTRLNSSH